MNLRKATSYACGLQFLALLANVYNYLGLFSRLHWEDNKEFFIMQPIWLLANAAMVLFLFVLLSDLKKS